MMPSLMEKKPVDFSNRPSKSKFSVDSQILAARADLLSVIMILKHHYA